MPPLLLADAPPGLVLKRGHCHSVLQWHCPGRETAVPDLWSGTVPQLLDYLKGEQFDGAKWEEVSHGLGGPGAPGPGFYSRIHGTPAGGVRLQLQCEQNYGETKFW